MAINRDKVFNDAMKLLAAGKFDKGIAELQKLVADDPKDVRTLLKIAETWHVKMGRRKEALETYDRAANLYTEQGFFLKAVAVFKQMLSVDATNPDMHLRLAELYQQMGYSSQCLLHYQQVVVLYEQQGRSKDTLGILKRMVDLDPENLQSRIKVAELFHQQGMVTEAITEMRQAFELLKNQQRFDDAVRVGEKVCAWDPNAVDVAKELGSIYMQRGDAKSALAKLQVCFRLTPRDLEVLNLIAGAFLALDQTTKSVSVYKEMARIYESNNDDARARSYWERVLEFSPGDDDAELALGRRQATVLAPSASTIATAGPTAPPVSRMSPEDDQLSRLMTETDVYVKYGLRDKAIEHLDKIFSLRPEYLPGLEKLRQLQNQTNQKAAAVETLRLMVKKGEEAGHAKLAEWKAELSRAGPAVAAKPAPVVAAKKPTSFSDEGEVILVDEDVPAPRPAPRAPINEDELATAARGRHPTGNLLASAPSFVSTAAVRGGRPAALDALDEPLEASPQRSNSPPVSRAPAPLPPDEHFDDFEAPTVMASSLPVSSVPRLPSFGDGQMAGLGGLPGLGLGMPPPKRTAPFAPAAAPPEVILDEPAEDAEIDADAVVRAALAMSAPAMPPLPPDSGLPGLAPPLGSEEGLPADELVLEQEDVDSEHGVILDADDAGMLDALAAQAVQEAVDDRSGIEFGIKAPGTSPSPLAAPAPMGDEFDDFNANNTVAYPGPSWQQAPGTTGPTADDSLVETGSRPAPVSAVSDGFEDFNLPDDVKDQLEGDIDDAFDAVAPGFPPYEPDGFDALDSLATGTFERGTDNSSLGDVPSLGSMDADAIIEVPSLGSSSAPGAPVGSGDDFADDAGQMSAVRGLFVPERGFEDDPANTFFPDELAEAEFFIQQDLLDEAREILEPILEEIDDSERVKHMLARVAAKEAGEHEPPAPWEQRLIDEVAAEIDELAMPAEPQAAPGQISVAEVLSQFKRGIAETVPEDDAATHYDLGIAYREMGLLEDAIGEFEVAARAASRAPDALFLIGIVRLEQQRTADAHKAFDAAISSPAATPAQRAAAEYERGVLFADVENDGMNGLIAFKRSKQLGGSSPDLDRRIQTLIKAHGDVEVPPAAARSSSDGRQKNIDYV